MTEYTGAFKKAYGPLKGSKWVSQLDSEARRIFVNMGNKFNEYGRRGGIARAKTADRDERGRFLPADPLWRIQYG